MAPCTARGQLAVPWGQQWLHRPRGVRWSWRAQAPTPIHPRPALATTVLGQRRPGRLRSCRHCRPVASPPVVMQLRCHHRQPAVPWQSPLHSPQLFRHPQCWRDGAHHRAAQTRIRRLCACRRRAARRVPRHARTSPGHLPRRRTPPGPARGGLLRANSPHWHRRRAPCRLWWWAWDPPGPRSPALLPGRTVPTQRCRLERRTALPGCCR
mmetsp:Transcript_39842/g.124281  ORF Transcript_39842/g.124281 Transcript_39842/m.124281 type:complete len:210 (-) Transcript_39842:1321-1950(-)